jgi:hypothetical protein
MQSKRASKQARKQSYMVWVNNLCFFEIVNLFGDSEGGKSKI